MAEYLEWLLKRVTLQEELYCSSVKNNFRMTPQKFTRLREVLMLILRSAIKYFWLVSVEVGIIVENGSPQSHYVDTGKWAAV